MFRDRCKFGGEWGGVRRQIAVRMVAHMGRFAPADPICDIMSPDSGSGLGYLGRSTQNNGVSMANTKPKHYQVFSAFALLLCLCLTAVALSACEDHAEEDCAGAAAIGTFTITPATVAAGGQVNAQLVVSNFLLGHHDGGGHAHACPNGHVHIYLDDLLTNPLAMPDEASSTVTIPAGTPAGEHQLIARLHGSDHKILKPEVSATAKIVVE